MSPVRVLFWYSGREYEDLVHVVVNLGCQCHWTKRYLETWSSIILNVSMKMFLEDANIWV
jgi:hypothetical protein